MCRGCRAIVPARVFFRDGAVWQESLCPTCKNLPARIAGNVDWYLDHMPPRIEDHSPLPGSRPPERGCPYDCSPCTWHASPCQLPVVSITNACNLRCPICFTYNRKKPLYFMPVEEMGRTIDWIAESSGAVDVINITGGEPTLHPDILSILDRCRRPEVGRVTMNSNGIRLAEDKTLCRELAERRVHVILSFHAFESKVSRTIHGRDVVEAKRKAIDNLTAAGATMTLLNVMIRDVNEESAGRILNLMRENDAILSLTVQTMTYTGQGGGKFPRSRHLPVDDAARLVSAQSEGDFAFSDFLPRPSAHPLCYLTTYLLKSEDRFIPFTRFAPRKEIAARMNDSYLLRVRDDDTWFRSLIDDLYARGETDLLKALRRVVEAVYPHGRVLDRFERQRAAESFVRTIYIHAHMDEDTFDCSRAMCCPDLVPSRPGSLVPACTYNLFYRMQDERFYGEDAE